MIMFRLSLAPGQMVTLITGEMRREEPGEEGDLVTSPLVSNIMRDNDNVSIMTQSPAIVRDWDSCK